MFYIYQSVAMRWSVWPIGLLGASTSTTDSPDQFEFVLDMFQEYPELGDLATWSDDESDGTVQPVHEWNEEWDRIDETFLPPSITRFATTESPDSVAETSHVGAKAMTHSLPIGAPRELEPLLPKHWTGDGVPFNPPSWSEELVFLSVLRERGPTYIADVFSEIQRLVPSTKWTIEDVARRMRRFTDLLIIPQPLFAMLFSLAEKGIADVNHVDVQDTLLWGFPMVPWEDIAEIARHWMDYCIVPRSPSAHPRCLEVRLETHGVALRAWAFTAPQIHAFLVDQQKKEIDKNSLIIRLPISALGKRKSVPEESQLRSLVIDYLIKNDNCQAAEMAQLIAERTDLALGAVTADQLEPVREEILTYTRVEPRFHDFLYQKRSVTFVDLQNEIGIAMPHLTNLTKRMQVWIKYCVIPLLNWERKRNGLRPCFIDHAGVYRLSKNSLVLYLKDQLHR